MRTGSKDYRNIVLNAWNSISRFGDIPGVMQRICKCSSELEAWNRSTFGSVSRNIRLAQARLHRLQGRDPLGLCLDEHKMARLEVQKWLEREEKLWRQRSRITGSFTIKQTKGGKLITLGG